jgi:glycosyltransferase involved in cell wall biosynthesis
MGKNGGGDLGILPVRDGAEMKNILFVSHSSELNGAELWLLDTLKNIDRQKYGLHVVVPRAGLLEEESRLLGADTEIVPMKWWITEPARVWRQPLAWLVNLRGVFRLSRLISSRKIDLVFSNSAAASVGALAARRAHVPHVWAIHEILRGERVILRFLFGRRVLAWLITRYSSRIIVNSRATLKAFRDLERIVLINNGIETIGRERDVFRETILREELGICADDAVIGVVGKIYEGKGQREIIQAVADLRPQFPRIKLLVVGDVKDARYYRSLQSLVGRRGLENNVNFLGYRRDLPDLLSLMRVMVIASVVESFGRVALHAMAAGVPVLAVSAGGIPEIIRHEVDGFLIESRRPAQIGQALSNILNNPGKALQVMHRGLQTVREKYSLEDQVQKIEKVIDECLGSGKAKG